MQMKGMFNIIILLLQIINWPNITSLVTQVKESHLMTIHYMVFGFTVNLSTQSRLLNKNIVYGLISLLIKVTVTNVQFHKYCATI